MKVIEYPVKQEWESLLKRPVIESVSLEASVCSILKDVKLNGDKALKSYAKKFDQVELNGLLVTDDEFSEAAALVSNALKKAIAIAKDNIEKFHSAQLEEVEQIETAPGVYCWRKAVAIEKVGLYIPGGSAPLFSTLLMLGVPAKIAGCKEIVVCTPAGQDEKVNPVILYVAALLGITKVVKVGGVQAIAGMAYGTESVPKVFKIFGPGNQYVTKAKQLVNQEGVAIDMPAGPSEVAVLADKSCVPAYVAADLLSQAEHGFDSQVVLVSDSKLVIDEVLTEIEMQVKKLPRKEIAEAVLSNSKSFLVSDLNSGLELLNEYAPEHLILACDDAENMAEQVVNAGSVFLGNFSCESAGDYASGTNHTLPTNGNAKAFSGVSLDSFVKKITFQKLTEQGIRSIGNAVELMAAAEGLAGHKNAISLRIKKLNSTTKLKL